MKNSEPIFAIQQRMPLSRFEIKHYLKRLLGTPDCSDQLVETVLNRDICLMFEGIDILGEFCDSTGVAPVGWREPGFSWNPEVMRVWASLNWDALSKWLSEKKMKNINSGKAM